MKLTQEELAEKLSVTRQAISNYETGKTQPDIETLNKIASILEVSVEELIYGYKRTNVVNNTTNVGTYQNAIIITFTQNDNYIINIVKANIISKNLFIC